MTEKTRENDVAFIRALAELLTENDLNELQVKREYGEGDSLNVRVSRGLPAPAPVAYAAAPAAPVPAHAAPPRLLLRPRPPLTAIRPRIPAPLPHRWLAPCIFSPNRALPPL